MEAKRILFFIGGAVDSFWRIWGDALIVEFEKMNCEVIVADIDNAVLLQNAIREAMRIPPLFAFGFNGMGFDVRTSKNVLLIEQLDIPFVAYLLDHSFNPNVAKLSIPYKKLITINMETSDAAYAIKRFSHIQLAACLPLAADCMSNDLLPYKERQIPVLFCASFYGYLAKAWEDASFGLRNILNEACEMILTSDTLSIQDGLFQAMQHKYIYADEFMYSERAHKLMNILNLYVRSRKRELLLEKLVQGGILIDVYGGPSLDSGEPTWGNWKYSERIRWHGPVTYKQTIELAANSKIVLNCGMFPHGIHDRVFTAMLNKAVVVTDGGTLFEEYFNDGEYAITYSWKELSCISEKVAHILSCQEKAEEMIQKSFQKVSKEHLWGNRAGRILELVELIF